MIDQNFNILKVIKKLVTKILEMFSQIKENAENLKNNTVIS